MSMTQAPETQSRNSRTITLIVAAIAAALVIRAFMFDHQSLDYKMFIRKWYEFIETHGGFGALRYSFSDYNMPYLYLLALLTYLPVPVLAGVKVISVVFDLVLAFFTYRIVALRYDGWRIPALAALLALFLPTVLTNSALWGQADAIYSAFGVGGVYFVLRKRPWLACVFFGLALAFKLQAVFLFPLLLVLALTKWLPWRALLAVPGVVLLLDIPALLAGAPLTQLLSVYLQQAGSYPALSLRAPSIYQFLPANANAELIRPIGVAVTVVVVLAMVFTVVRHRITLNPTRIVLLASTSAVLVPFLLPSMHERYFYLAEVLTLIAAFHLPRRLWYVPLLVQAATFPAYLDVLFPDNRSGGMVLSGPPNGQAPPPGQGGGKVIVGGGGDSSAYAPTLEYRILATFMALAVIAVLWTAFRECRRTEEDDFPR